MNKLGIPICPNDKQTLSSAFIGPREMKNQDLPGLFHEEKIIAGPAKITPSGRALRERATDKQHILIGSLGSRFRTFKLEAAQPLEGSSRS